MLACSQQRIMRWRNWLLIGMFAKVDLTVDYGLEGAMRQVIVLQELGHAVEALK